MSDQLDQGQATTAAPVGGDAPVAQPATPELTIQDLNNLRAIIDVASQRGAFRAPELEAVGSAFNKLNSFLNAVAPQKPADDSASASDTTDEAQAPAA